MSVSLWAYAPERCDDDYCPGDCDRCEKIDDAMAMTEINELNALIAACHNRKYVRGVSVCVAQYLPCEIAVGDGKCEVCAQYFRRGK